MELASNNEKARNPRVFGGGTNPDDAASVAGLSGLKSWESCLILKPIFRTQNA